MCYYVIILIEYECELSFDTHVVEMPSGGVFPRAAKNTFLHTFRTHTHTHLHTENPRVYSKNNNNNNMQKANKKTKTNANRSQNYKTKTNYIIKYLYTGILMGERVSQSEASVRLLCALRHLFRTTGYTVHGLNNNREMRKLEMQMKNRRRNRKNAR